MASFFKNLFRKENGNLPKPATAPTPPPSARPAPTPIFEPAGTTVSHTEPALQTPGNPFSPVAGSHMTVRELASLLPPWLLRFDGVSPDLQVPLPVAPLRKSMDAGRPVICLSEIQQACPSLFLQPVLPENDQEVTLPVARVKRILETNQLEPAPAVPPVASTSNPFISPPPKPSEPAPAHGRSAASPFAIASTPVPMEAPASNPFAAAAPSPPPSSFRPESGNGSSTANSLFPVSPVLGRSPFAPAQGHANGDGESSLFESLSPANFPASQPASPRHVETNPSAPPSGPTWESPFAVLHPPPAGSPASDPAPAAADLSRPMTPQPFGHPVPAKEKPAEPVAATPDFPPFGQKVAIPGLDPLPAPAWSSSRPGPAAKPFSAFPVPPSTAANGMHHPPESKKPEASLPPAPAASTGPVPGAADPIPTLAPAASASGEGARAPLSSPGLPPLIPPAPASESARPAGNGSTLPMPETMEISLRAALRDADPAQLGFSPGNVPETVRLTLPVPLVVRQLATGQVEVTIADIRQGIAEKFHPAFARASADLKVVLPMSEVFHNLPEAAKPSLAPATSPVPTLPRAATSPFQTPFALKAAEDEAAQQTPAPATSTPPPESPAAIGTSPVNQFPPLPAAGPATGTGLSASGPPSPLQGLPADQITQGPDRLSPTPRSGMLSRPPGGSTAPQSASPTPPRPRLAPRLRQAPPSSSAIKPFPKPAPPAPAENAAPNLLPHPAADAHDDLGESFSAATLGTEPPPRAGSTPVAPPLPKPSSPVPSITNPSDTAPAPAASLETAPSTPVPVADLVPDAPLSLNGSSHPPADSAAAAPSSQPASPFSSQPAGQPPNPFSSQAPPGLPASPATETGPVMSAFSRTTTFVPAADSPAATGKEPSAPTPPPLPAPASATPWIPAIGETPGREPETTRIPPAPASVQSPAATGTPQAQDEPHSPEISILDAPEPAPPPAASNPEPAVESAAATRSSPPVFGEDLTYGCVADIRQLTLRAVLGTNQPLTTQNVVDRCAGLPGLKACVLFRGGETLVSHGMDASEAAAFQESAVRTRDSLAVLAEAMGLGNTGNFTLRTDHGVRSFFLEGELCLAVWHDQPAFAGGTREKLILIAQELAKNSPPA